MSDLLARIGAGGLWAAAHALTTTPLKQLTLEQPWWLLAVLVMPWLAVVLLRTQARPVLRFARGEDAAALPVGRGVVLRMVAHVLLLVTVALVVVTLAKPQLPGEPDPATTERAAAAMPHAARRRRATAPAATRAAVSRALARSRTSRRSLRSNFSAPARSA